MANETLRKTMADYHDLVDSGRRETIESRADGVLEGSSGRAKGGLMSDGRMSDQQLDRLVIGGAQQVWLSV